MADDDDDDGSSVKFAGKHGTDEFLLARLIRSSFFSAVQFDLLRVVVGYCVLHSPVRLCVLLPLKAFSVARGGCCC